MKTDTIAAIASAMSNSGIGIIRISGEDSFTIIDKIYKSSKADKKLSQEKTHTIHYGYIYDEDEIIDEVLVLLMKAPNSYTAEHTVEIDCHGGVLVMQRILETVIKNGARLAEPGEFTKRAFLNGRIDLSKAEAVMDVINSQNEFALKASIKQLKGSVFEKIKQVREKLIYEIAFIESALDDPEHICIDGYAEKLEEVADKIRGDLERLLTDSENGRILKEGIKTVILGKPNAGKSSLLNLLAGEERAIVTDIAGTTRDVLEAQIRIHGIQLNVIDTAGIRSTEDIVERIGVQKAKDYAEDADLIIYVVDASTPLEENDFEIIELLKDKKAIVLLNKTDLIPVTTEAVLEEKIKKPIICISAKENQGIDELEKKIKELFLQGEVSFNDEIYITNIRHKNLLEESLKSLNMVKNSIQNNMPEDFYSIDLMGAYTLLGEIIGEEVGEDLVNEIFSKFCMGK